MHLQTIIPIVILLIIFAYIFFVKFTDKKSKEDAEKFLESIKTVFEDFIIDYLEHTDITNFMNLTDAQMQILNNLYDNLWEIAKENLETYIADDFTKMLIRNYLTRKNIEEFVKAVFESATVQEVFTEKYNVALLAANKEAIILEAKHNALWTKIDNGTYEPIEDNNEIEDIDDRDINRSIDSIELNPQKDDEEDIDLKDDSVEIIE